MPLQPADASAERQPGDARVADDADRADETVGLRRDIELSEERTAVRPRRPRLAIDSDAAHPRQIDDEAASQLECPGPL